MARHGFRSLVLPIPIPVPDVALRQRGALLLITFLSLLALPAWGASFTGELRLAVGSGAEAGPADAQCRFESFTFVLDADGREYDLVESEGELPHRTTRGTLFGTMVDRFTIAVESFTEEAAAREAAVVWMPVPPAKTASLLTIKVNLDGSWPQPAPAPPIVFTLGGNSITEENLRYHFWERQWNVQRYFDIASRYQYTFDTDLDGDEVPDYSEVTLTPDPGPCQLVDVTSCTQIRAAANCVARGGEWLNQQSTTRSSVYPITTESFGGQTFTPSVSGDITWVDLSLDCPGCSGTRPDLTLSIRATAAGLPTGADLASATVADFPSSGWRKAIFGTPFAVTAGTTYAIVIRPTANPVPGYYRLHGSNTDVYAGGTRVEGATNGTVWSAPAIGGVSTDAAFKVYVHTGTGPVVDPHDAVDYFHRVYVGPEGWGCGSDLATVGSSTSSFVDVIMSESRAKGATFPHQLGHNLGLEHSNKRDPATGAFAESGDRGSMMGVSYSDFWMRYGFNAVQLYRWGAIDEARVVHISDTTTNWSGKLHSTYFQETTGAVTKLISFFPSNTWALGYRSPTDQTIDQQVGIGYTTSIPSLLFNPAGRVLLYKVEPISYVDPNGNSIKAGMVTLEGSIGAGETRTYAGVQIRAEWKTADAIYLRIGPSPPSAPPPPSPIVSVGTLVAVADATDSFDPSTTSLEATCKQPSDSASCSTSNYELETSGPAGQDMDLFARLKINVAQGTPVNARLVMETTYGFSFVPEFVGGSGSTTLQVQVEDTDSATPLVSGTNVRDSRVFSAPQSTTFPLPLHGGDEVAFDVTGLLQNLVNRPGWTAGNYVLFRVRRTAADASVRFFGARSNGYRTTFVSPRAIVEVAPSGDLAITNTNGVTSAAPGGSVTYTITASNPGPGNAMGARVTDLFPASLTATWTCVGARGGTCTAAGSGNIDDRVNLPSGGRVTYTVTAFVSPIATGTLSNTATVAGLSGFTDPTPGNNSATDTDTLAPVGFPGSTPSSSTSGAPLLVRSNPSVPDNIDLSWGATCGSASTGYALYEGVLGSFYGHSVFGGICNLNGYSATNQVPATGDRYYLVVPVNGTLTEEGIYGTSSAGAPIPPGASPCFPVQNTVSCP